MFAVRRFSSHSVNRNLAQFANEVNRGFTSRLQTVELDQREGVRLGFTRRERKKSLGGGLGLGGSMRRERFRLGYVWVL